MVYTRIKNNSYYDSINLMLLTNAVNNTEGVKSAQVMMGTSANKDLLKDAGLYNDEVENAAPNDMIVAVDADDEAVIDRVMEEVEEFLSDLSVKKESSPTQKVTNWEDALANFSDANMALISIPGMYAASEIERALDNDLHTFVFSDNVPLEDEVRLKKKAHEKGLLLMGPDSGTGILANIPIAFTNVVKPGNIGVVGASGTGIQEVTSTIDRLGGGVMHAIGTGGRDLSEDVGAISMLDGLAVLNELDEIDVLVVISKPPAPSVRDKVVNELHALDKPVVAIFVGEKPRAHEGDVYFAYTLEETAKMAVDLANGDDIKDSYREPLANPISEMVAADKKIIGLYSGGTLASEAKTLIADALNSADEDKTISELLDAKGYEILDLGDDQYTQGKPHPMIDPSVRIEKLKEYGAAEDTGVILLDVVLGYGSHTDMANALKPTLEEILSQAKEAGRDLKIVGTVCGTLQDPQDYEQTKQTLKDAGVLVEDTNERAVRLALELLGMDFTEEKKDFNEYTGEKERSVQPSEKLIDLLKKKPRVINIGLESFGDTIKEFGGEAIQFDWQPRAGGDPKLIRILDELDKMADEIDEQNSRVVERLKNGAPFLVDVVLAKTVIPELNEKVLLHAGPPIKWEEMTGPMQGSCIGAALFEGWAETEDEARTMLENGEVSFIPCHDVDAVGPMGGITSGNMAVMVVENRTDGNKAYSTMNEGIGAVLRFGAYSEEVVNRLHWMKDVLGPVLSKAIKQTQDGLNLSVMIAQAIAMGDEFHQRNHAASLIFLKEVAPSIVSLRDVDEKHKQDVIQFLADTDQFFLNIMMAAGKAITDGARKVQEGTIVSALSRNGKDFGIRVSALGDEWFTAPVNTPKGLYFTGYSEEDGNPDIGDSAITETVGVGGMAMIAAPAVTRFVGAGGFQDALEVSNEMDRITFSNNANWSIPTWDFKGAPLGIDIRKVVETGITPIINTGIAHKVAGVGQVGAGTVRAPLACFEKALIAYAKSVGIEVDDDE